METSLTCLAAPAPLRVTGAHPSPHGRRRLAPALGWLIALLTLVTALPAADAYAQTASADEEARAQFEAGRMAFGRGRYEQALANFEEAYRLSGRTALLYNIGTTHDRLRHDQEALDAFRQYLEAEPESELSEEVRERVRILEEQVANQPDLSPETVAAQADTSAPPPEPSESQPITRKWWFWTIIGVVVVGTAVGVGVAAGGGGGTQGPQLHDGNTVVIAL